jgi:uncharacterized OsmC-like protein
MSIADAVANASRYLSQHPDEARYRDSYARATVKDGLAVKVEGPGGESLRTDMPKGIGGTASAPSPGWTLRAAEASCVASLIVIRAAALGIEVGGITVEVDSESDDRGILGLDEAIPAGPISTRVSVSLEVAGNAQTDVDALVRWAVDHCPVIDALQRAVPVDIEWHLA